MSERDALHRLHRVAAAWGFPAVKAGHGGARKNAKGGVFGRGGADIFPNDPMRRFGAMMIVYAVDDWRRGGPDIRKHALEFLLSPECDVLCDFVDVFTFETLIRLLGIGEK